MGIPLAIELAAARMKTLGPAQIATRLGDRFQLLVGGSRNAAPRQQTLEATLTWSYELLSPEERRLFEQLAVFSGGWELEAAELICTDETSAPRDVLNGLDRLVDRSLVQAQQGRFRLLETVREYAHQRLRETAAVGALHERHAHYYLRFAETAEPELKRVSQAVWFERLALEHDNFRAVLRWSLAEERLEVGLRLATALQRFWETRGHWSEARRWLLDLLDTPGTAAQPTPLRAAALAHAGTFAHLLRDHAVARQLLEEGLHLARTAGTAGTAAFALHGLAEITLSLGDRTAARPLLQESLALARQLDDAWATARVLSNLTGVARDDGDIELARSLAEEGISIARRGGERRIESTIPINLASLHEGDPVAARGYLEHALATKQDLGDHYGAGRAFHGLGWLAFDRGDHLSACQHFWEAWATARDLGVSDRPSADRPSTLAGLASVAVRLGDAERAVRLFAADAHIAESGGVQQSEYLPEPRRLLLEAAQQALGMAAGRQWAEGWGLPPDGVQAEVSAVARMATCARQVR
jgi:tetratricopeptide (TPR) repeat protein